ncbi:klarsicht isoform X2 [Haemaphysalis longicornis]
MVRWSSRRSFEGGPSPPSPGSSHGSGSSDRGSSGSSASPRGVARSVSCRHGRVLSVGVCRQNRRLPRRFLHSEAPGEAALTHPHETPPLLRLNRPVYLTLSGHRPLPSSTRSRRRTSNGNKPHVVVSSSCIWPCRGVSFDRQPASLSGRLRGRGRRRRSQSHNGSHNTQGEPPHDRTEASAKENHHQPFQTHQRVRLRTGGRKNSWRTTIIHARDRHLKVKGDIPPLSQGMENPSPTGTLQRNGPEPRKDDFWEALSSNYNYLMNDELIASCREASGELALDESRLSPPPRETLSFAEFVRQFNLLHDWLHQLQSSLLDSDSDRKADVAALVGQELHRREPSLSLFLEEAQGLAALHPALKEEVGRRVNLLSNKREAVQRALDPDRAAALAPALGEAFQEVGQEMRCLRRWLKELESRLPSQMAVSTAWTQAEIQERLRAQQVLQQEIESRSVRVKSLLRQCEALCAGTGAAAAAAAAADGKNASAAPAQSPLTTPHAKQQFAPPTTSTPLRPCLDGADKECAHASLPPLFANDAQRIRRVAANLEKRWHALWLRSLEWQCLLEQLLQGSRGLWETGSDCCFGDEPKTKQPRLSREWDGGGSNMTTTCNGTMDNVVSNAKDPRAEEEKQQSIAVPPALPTRLEKGVMVGQTGITDLKMACKVGSGRRFELLHDVGYSSESSTQLSSEDCIRIYSYSPESSASLFREYRDGLARDGLEEENGGGALFEMAEDAEYEEGEYEASPLIQANVSNVDFYKMTLLEEAPFSDQNGDDSLAGGAGCLDEEEMDFAEFEELGGDAKASGTGAVGKSDRVRRWLQNCKAAPLTAAGAAEDEEEEAASVTGGCEGRVDSSCDASGEYTTNDESEEPGAESDGSSHHSSRGSSSQGLDTSRSMSLLSKSGTGSVETVVQVGSSAVLSEGDAVAPRVILRQGLRKKRSRERPWSVIELGPQALQLSPHSTSETALNLLAAASSAKPQGRPRTSSVGIQKDPSSPDRRPRRSRGVRGLRSGSSSEALSGSSSAHKRQKSGDDSGRRMRRTSATSLSTGTAGSLQNVSSSSGTENYQDCLGVPFGVSKSSHLFSRAPTLAHVEEQSSVSDQVWDDYQDPPYFSEPYSEQTADEDQVKKLLDFGDDYWAFIGSPSDTSSLSGQPLPKRPPHKSRSANKPGGTTEFDSDSDIEDLHHLLGQSNRAYSFIRNSLHKMALPSSPSGKDAPPPGAHHQERMSPPKFAELVATCQTNLHWLKMIRIHLHTGEDSPQLQKLISQWEALVSELQGASAGGHVGKGDEGAVPPAGAAAPPPSQSEVLHNIGTLREELSSLTALVNRPNPMAAGGGDGSKSPSCDFQALEQRAHELKVALASLHDIRDALLDVKVKAHRLGASGRTDDVGLAIGEHIQALYRQWDDAYEQSGAKLTELQRMQSQWKMQRDAPPECPDAAKTLLHSPAGNGTTLEKPVVRRTAVTTEPRRSQPVAAACSAAAALPGGGDSSGAHNRRRRLWRVLKAALPVQVALVLLYCVACLLEPHCCDLLNNFSFGPQLRYTQGPPPI